MKLVRMKTLGIFGLGFLAGSRAGRGPWEKAEQTMEQLKEKVGSSDLAPPFPPAQDGQPGPHNNTPTTPLG